MISPSSVGWNKGCISQRLATIADKGKGILPDEVCSEIERASARTYTHENRTYAFPTSNADPNYIYTGYARAFDPLIQYLLDPDTRAEMYGIQLHVCSQLLLHLRRILGVLKARGSDAQCMTYNRAVDVLVSEIDRVL